MNDFYLLLCSMLPGIQLVCRQVSCFLPRLKVIFLFSQNLILNLLPSPWFN